MTHAAKRKMLVVDDNTNFLDMMNVVFGEEYHILQAEDGRQGMVLARRENPDVILLDVMMPKVSGVEMLRELQSDYDTRRIPVIVLTASALDKSTMSLIEREVNVKAFLRKPCGTQKLRDQVKLALQHPPQGS